MNIALDAMGGDHAPGEIVAGAVLAAREYGITVSLVGQPDVLNAELAKHATTGLDLPIVPASQVIEMDDKPAQAVRTKLDSTMVVASRMVKSGAAQAFVTAGNTGGALAAGILHIGRIKGILRPALITPFPTFNGFCTILDVGANADVRPEYLPQFAIMGSIYAERVLGRKQPVVGILSNGEEEGKGNQLVISATQLLVNTPNINFRGNIESKEVIEGLADVIITDGFTGNIFIKTAEATARMLMRGLREELSGSLVNKLGALLARSGLRRARDRFDDSPYGGAVLLGLAGIVVVAHGRSNADAIRHGIRVAKQAVEQDVPGKIAQGASELTQSVAESTLSKSNEPLIETP
ncbi:MAG: phosphate acyltransferase PlsX [Caldilineaceae bacterium]|nr:phosphate acyltransferase PlsX [Caldilineaceae bacterium]